MPQDRLPAGPPARHPEPATDTRPPELTAHPRYRLVRLLGQGGMGAVYLAEHLVMERPVALKVIRANLLNDAGAIARFRQEIKAAARLDHPNIVRAFDADSAGSLHFLVTEFVDGLDLFAYLRRFGILPTQIACNFIRQACLGVQHAHERGMVHRDIKPSNLLLTREGVVKVLDFGLARFVYDRGANGDHGLTGPLEVMGTADYMAPEQAIDSRTADHRADVYALGCTLYHLLTGRVPFPGGSVVEKAMRHTTDVPPPLAQMRADLPPELAEVVGRMMAKRPEDRYQTASDAAAALAGFAVAPSESSRVRLTFAGVTGKPATVPPAPGRTVRFPRGSIAALAALVLLAAGLAAAGAWYWRAAPGRLTVTSPAGVTVVVRQGGREMARFGSDSGPAALPAGDYELELVDAPADLFLADPRVHVPPGATADVGVSRLPPARQPKLKLPARLERARAALTAGDWKRVTEEAGEALALAPENPDALALRGRARTALGQFDTAAQDLEVALAANPADAEWLAASAEAANGLGWHDLATADTDIALRVRPGLPAALAARAWARACLGEYLAAREDYDAALAAGPKADWLLRRSAVKARLGDAAGAAADRRHAGGIDPKAMPPAIPDPPPTATVDPTPGKGDFATLREALAAARPGSTVRLRPGTYREPDVVAVARRVRILGEGKPGDVVLEVTNTAGRVALTFTEAGSVLRNVSVRAPAWVTVQAVGPALLDGCRFVGGPAGAAEFGAASLAGPRPVLARDCQFGGPGHATGLTVEPGGSARLHRVTAAGNRGAGVVVSVGGRLAASECEFRDNGTFGVHYLGPGRLVAEECSFAGNGQTGLYAGDGDALLRNCRLTGNAQFGIAGLANARVVAEGCDLSGNAGGVSEFAPGGILETTRKR